MRTKTRTVGSLKLLAQIIANNNATAKAAGHKIARWLCAHCSEPNECTAPKKADVTEEKPFLDTAKTCVHCGQICFVAVYPNATNEVKPATYAKEA